MPFSWNPLDGCAVYFEDDGGPGRPVVVLNGLGDPVQASRRWGVLQELAKTYRLILVDHRGHGRSEKPHDMAAYATPARVADVISVLDQLGVEKAHFIGLSWGARLLFGVGEHAPSRVASLAMGGQSPYALKPSSLGVAAVTAAFSAGKSMADFVEAMGGFGGIDDETRAWTLANDFEALSAAWRAAMAEGDIAPSLSRWTFPCLIYAGSEDVDFHQDARRAATEIPRGQFVTLSGLNHLAAHENVDGILPHIQRLLELSD